MNNYVCIEKTFYKGRLFYVGDSYEAEDSEKVPESVFANKSKPMSKAAKEALNPGPAIDPKKVRRITNPGHVPGLTD